MKGFFSFFVSGLVFFIIGYGVRFLSEQRVIKEPLKFNYLCESVRSQVKQCGCKIDLSSPLINNNFVLESVPDSAEGVYLRKIYFDPKEDYKFTNSIRQSDVEGQLYFILNEKKEIIDFGYNEKP